MTESCKGSSDPSRGMAVADSCPKAVMAAHPGASCAGTYTKKGGLAAASHFALYYFDLLLRLVGGAEGVVVIAFACCFVQGRCQSPDRRR